MRLSLFAAVLSLFACSNEVEQTLDLPGEEQWAPPQQGVFTMTATGFAPGGVGVLTVSGAGLQERIYLERSFSGAGSDPCLPQAGGLCLGLALPTTSTGSARGDVNGQAIFAIPIPPNAPIGATAHFEAFAIRGLNGRDSVSSNTLEVTLGTTTIDADGDGFDNSIDCDDNDPTVFPGAIELCDGIDNDCNLVIDDGQGLEWYIDRDSDGFGDPASAPVLACTPPFGFVAQAGDCVDSDSTINPAAVEFCDGLDNNCNGLVDEGVCP